MIDFQQEVADLLQDDRTPGSHTEPEPSVFHPSQIANCNRQCYISKLGLEEHDVTTLGTFKMGTLIHEYFEHNLSDRLPAVFEIEIQDQVDGITFTGHADCFDYEHEIVYDFKSRSSWYRFDPPTQRHIDQLLVYMHALDVQEGQVVYVSKKNLEVKTWPEDDTFAFDVDRYEALVRRARHIRDVIATEGIARTKEDIPFEKCGCWICDNESLSVSV